MSEHTKASIRPVKQRVEDELLARPGVTGVDISTKTKDGVDTGELSIVVYVKQKKSKRSLKADEVIPAEIDGIPTDVVEEEIVLHASSTMLLEEAQVDGSTYATLQGGISMGPCRSVFLSPPDVPAAGNYIFVGTLGAIVKDRASGAQMALTNFHVACVDSTWAVGNTMTHPARNDGGSCPAGKFGSLTRAVLSGHVDGAVVSIDAGKATDCSIAEIGKVKGQATAAVDMAVRKRGRTTGLTYGFVKSVDYTTAINYGNGLGTVTLYNQIRVERDSAHSTQFGDHGDSGSVVVNADNKVVGLHFAGNSTGTIGIANPIQFVLDELNVDLCVDSITIVTKPVICTPLLTKPVVCVVSKPIVCSVVTKPVLCNVLTKPSVCVITKVGCPPVTAACPPRSLVCGPTFPGPGTVNPGPRAASSEDDPMAAYGTATAETGADDSFWLGYYTALSAVDEATRDDADSSPEA